jgi:hypothetical protein
VCSLKDIVDSDDVARQETIPDCLSARVGGKMHNSIDAAAYSPHIIKLSHIRREKRISQGFLRLTHISQDEVIAALKVARQETADAPGGACDQDGT